MVPIQHILAMEPYGEHGGPMQSALPAVGMCGAARSETRMSASDPVGLVGRLRSDAHGLADEDLLRLCAAGESAALEELVRRHQAPIYRFLMRLLGSAE